MMIASENHCSAAVREACGSRITDKYAEGYPSRRYYGGCEVADAVEEVARQRAVKLFGAADALREQTGTPVESFNRERYDHDLNAARSAMPDADFDAAWKAGRNLAPDEAVEAALSGA